MRRVVIHEILIGGGAALLMVAALTTGAAQRSIGSFEREAADLRAAVVAEKPEKGERGEEWLNAQRQLAEAEFNVRAARELRARLWRPGGLGLMATVGGVVVLGAGALVRRRTSATR